MTFFNTIKEGILNTIFPMKCISCQKSGSNFCIECLADSPAAERESLEWIFPIFDYRHPPIKKALWLLKYKNKKKFANIFAEVLHGKILEEVSELGPMQNFRDPILIPIPLSKQRHRERGYNQAELLARELVKIDTDLNFKLLNNVLIKPKDTEHQARIKNRAERLKNIIGSFAIKLGSEDTMKKRNIILIDDILTTGATLSEAKKVLKSAGARKIIAFTVAH